MEISRDKYLQELIDRKHNGLVKVVTGIRRVGKSYLLFNLYYRHLINQGVDADHIIRIAFDDRRFAELKNPDALIHHIDSLMTDSKMYYLLFDEVQELDSFESVLNSLLYLENADIYVTGSNSRFLSKDILTEFRGRGDEVHLYPLTFAEFMSVYDGDKYEGWNEYYTFGGLPMVLKRKTWQQKSEYLSQLFTETYLKDIIARNNIKHAGELDTLITVLASAVGSLTNPKRISDTFKTETSSSISPATVKSYLDYLEDAFLIKGVQRYDVKGRRYITTPLKYYFEDVGLRNARLNFRQQEENHIMENIIYNELRKRGYNVDVGVVDKQEKQADGKYIRKQYEVDFIVNQGSLRYYIQSAFSLPDDEKVRQEKMSLLNIDDSFKKIIVVKGPAMLKRDNDGVVTMSIFDFLLNENSLDF
ncbi:MAG TPA: ATP-binding protein [Methanocorpusculum sp.]|nr:ATP-binding protein [Methanocorpusculum sp.]